MLGQPLYLLSAVLMLVAIWLQIGHRWGAYLCWGIAFVVMMGTALLENSVVTVPEISGALLAGCIFGFGARRIMHLRGLGLYAFIFGFLASALVLSSFGLYYSQVIERGLVPMPVHLGLLGIAILAGSAALGNVLMARGDSVATTHHSDFGPIAGSRIILGAFGLLGGIGVFFLIYSPLFYSTMVIIGVLGVGLGALQHTLARAGSTVALLRAAAWLGFGLAAIGFVWDGVLLVLVGSIMLGSAGTLAVSGYGQQANEKPAVPDHIEEKQAKATAYAHMS